MKRHKQQHYAGEQIGLQGIARLRRTEVINDEGHQKHLLQIHRDQSG